MPCSVTMRCPYNFPDGGDCLDFRVGSIACGQSLCGSSAGSHSDALEARVFDFHHAARCSVSTHSSQPAGSLLGENVWVMASAVDRKVSSRSSCEPGVAEE